MDENTYREGVRRTWHHAPLVPRDALEMLNAAIGIAGEAGEVAEIIKKYAFHGKDIDVVKFIDEMGDLRYYYTRLLDLFGVSDADVKRWNHDKLAKRYPEGFVEGGGIR